MSRRTSSEVVTQRSPSPSLRSPWSWTAPLLTAITVTLGIIGSAELKTSKAAEPQPVTAAATISGVHRSLVIGYSRQHRPIVAYEMGNPTAPFKTVVLGSMHGYYERAGEQVVAAIRKLPVSSAIDLWVIPTLNPDGDALHQRGNRAGVDLNRNFPVGWAYIAPTSSKFDSHYSGPRALSEPESLAMYKFLGKIRPNR